MNITETKTGTALTLKLEGRLDGVNSPVLEKIIERELDGGVTALTLDFAGVEYMSSAGIRVVSAAHKRLTKQGGKESGLVIKNVNGDVMEIFEVTRLTRVLNIEE
jgi:anti-sigma B factor antagonist